MLSAPSSTGSVASPRCLTSGILFSLLTPCHPFIQLLHTDSRLLRYGKGTPEDPYIVIFLLERTILTRYWGLPKSVVPLAGIEAPYPEISKKGNFFKSTELRINEFFPDDLLKSTLGVVRMINQEVEGKDPTNVSGQYQVHPTPLCSALYCYSILVSRYTSHSPVLCSLPLTDYSIPQAKTYGKDGHVIGVHVAQQPQTLFWATAEHDAMIEQWTPPIEIIDDDISIGSPVAGSSSVGSSSQDAALQKRSRANTDILGMGNNRWGHDDEPKRGKGKGKGKKREASPKGGKGGAAKKPRKSAASDPANDFDMEKYEEKRVAELKRTYVHLIDEHNHQRIANLQLIGNAASAGESLVSSHSPVLHSIDISIH